MLVIHFEYTYFSACYEMKKILFGCGSVFIVMWSQNKATVITLYTACIYINLNQCCSLVEEFLFFFKSRSSCLFYLLFNFIQSIAEVLHYKRCLELVLNFFCFFIFIIIIGLKNSSSKILISWKLNYPSGHPRCRLVFFFMGALFWIIDYSYFVRKHQLKLKTL